MNDEAAVQPTKIQIQQCLQVLEGLEGMPWSGGRADHLGRAVPDGLMELLSDAPDLRVQAVADARMRLAGGIHPTADDLAERLVGRLVCDRLR